MKRTLVQLGLAAAMAWALTGCGGGSDGVDGAPGANGASGTQGPAGGGVAISTLTAEQWAGLQLQGQINSVTVNSPPEITFTVTDAAGNPITGLEKNTTLSSTALVPSYANVSATFAKLVPGTAGSPSKWVSYLVTTVATKSAGVTPTKPSSDSNGTLTYLGAGQYKYVFYRDIKQSKAILDAATYTGNNVKDDLGDVTWDPNVTNRVVISISGNQRGTGTNTADATDSGVVANPLGSPLHLVYDFVPATGVKIAANEASVAKQRNIVNVNSCMECHSKFSFHSGGRQDTQFCVTCHTDQRKYGNAEAVLTADKTGYNTTSPNPTSVAKINGMATMNLPVFIHKIHMGEELTKANTLLPGNVLANETKYPQIITNCVKCHDGTAGGTPANTTNKVTFTAAQGDNWKNVPNRLACGSCHDGIDFKTGLGTNLDGRKVGHGAGGVQTDDSKCAICHTADVINTVHTPVSPPNAANSLLAGGTNANTNAAWIAGNTTHLPAGAIKVTYNIKSVSRNASKQPVIVFQMLQDGVAVPFKTYDPAGNVATQEMWDNFMGSPSAYFVYSQSQDGIAKPTDFNGAVSGYLRSIWNGKATGTGAGTLIYDSATKFYTLTLTGVVIPDDAVMLTGGLGYTYGVVSTMPLTQTNLAAFPTAAATATAGLNAIMPNRTGGLIVIAPDAQVVASAGCIPASSNCGTSKAADGTYNYVGRRVIVEDARCNNCHTELGVFNSESFHAGQRNDGTTCSWCHKPNQTSSGWSADSTYFVHAIHGKDKRTVPFTWHAASTTDGFWNIGYPGVLNKCEQCHKPGTYDFSASTNAGQVPNRLYRTVGAGTYTSTPSTNPALTVFAYSPYVQKDVNYGLGFSINAATGVSTAAAGTTLVNSPILNACVSCHDSDQAKLHMTGTGNGSFYSPRSTALSKQEECLLCHGNGTIADIRVMHAK